MIQIQFITFRGKKMTIDFKPKSRVRDLKTYLKSSTIYVNRLVHIHKLYRVTQTQRTELSDDDTLCDGDIISQEKALLQTHCVVCNKHMTAHMHLHELGQQTCSNCETSHDFQFFDYVDDDASNALLLSDDEESSVESDSTVNSQSYEDLEVLKALYDKLNIQKIQYQDAIETIDIQLRKIEHLLVQES